MTDSKQALPPMNWPRLAREVGQQSCDSASPRTASTHSDSTLRRQREREGPTLLESTPALLQLTVSPLGEAEASEHTVETSHPPKRNLL